MAHLKMIHSVQYIRSRFKWCVARIVLNWRTKRRILRKEAVAPTTSRHFIFYLDLYLYNYSFNDLCDKDVLAVRLQVLASVINKYQSHWLCKVAWHLKNFRLRFSGLSHQVYSVLWKNLLPPSTHRVIFVQVNDDVTMRRKISITRILANQRSSISERPSWKTENVHSTSKMRIIGTWLTLRISSH